MIGQRVSAYEACRMCLAIKQHFDSESYDVFEAKGAFKYPKSVFEKRRDKALFDKVAGEVLRGDLPLYYAANIMVGNTHISEMSDLAVREFKSKLHGLEYTFDQDLKLMASVECDFRDVFISITGKLPIALQLLKGGHISVETMCVLHDCTNGELMLRFNEQIRDKHVWPKLRNQIVKTTPFVKYNKQNIKQIFSNY